MKISIIIPVYNESEYLSLTLNSLLAQSYLVHQIILVDDNSSDNSWEIIKKFEKEYPNITGVQAAKASSEHIPGSKVVRAFSHGLGLVDKSADVLCKFDSDLIFPQDYIENLVSNFEADSEMGIWGGVCSVEGVNGDFVTEIVADKDHVRGALKAYRTKCFEQIGGLKEAMGWDTVDELLASYYKWSVVVDSSAVVKHLRPTGASYKFSAQKLRGEALYKMGYGVVLSAIAALKMALVKRNLILFFVFMNGFLSMQLRREGKLVDKPQEKFIRDLRWNRIKGKLFPKKH